MIPGTEVENRIDVEGGVQRGPVVVRALRDVTSNPAEWLQEKTGRASKVYVQKIQS